MIAMGIFFYFEMRFSQDFLQTQNIFVGETNNLEVAMFLATLITSLISIILFLFSIACWINAWLEGKAKKKEEEKKYEDHLSEQFHKEDFLEMSKRLGLKETPHDMLELFHIAKKEGKWDKVSRIVAEVTKERMK